MDPRPVAIFLADEVLERMGGRVVADDNSQPLLIRARGLDCLDRRTGRCGEGEGRVADGSSVNRAGLRRLEQRRRRWKLDPMDFIRNAHERVRRFQYGARVSLLIADPQEGFCPG